MSVALPAQHRSTSLELFVTGCIVATAAGLAVIVAWDGTLAWRLVRVVMVAAVAVLAHWTMRRGWMLPATISGIVAVAVSAGYLPHRLGSLTLLGLVAPITVATSLGLVTTSTIVALRSRGLLGRILGSVGVLVGLALVASVVTPAVVATNVAERPIGDAPDSRGLAYEEVSLVDQDGHHLAAWYLASTNGAAVVLRHGASSTRSSVLDQAAVLAGHGYGVLLTDARGHGQSDGRAMDFGWNGDEDIAAATAFLVSRPEVDRARIGAVGLSMGGEEAIGAALTNPFIRAVVAEGATGRTAGDTAWLSDRYGLRGSIQIQIERLQYALTDLLTEAEAPPTLRHAVLGSEARFLLVTAGTVSDERHAAQHIASAAPDRVEIWTVDGASHTRGLTTDPDGWERTVVGFLDRHLDR